MNSAQSTITATPLRRLSAWVIDIASLWLVTSAILFVGLFLEFMIREFLWSVDSPRWVYEISRVVMHLMIWSICIAVCLGLLKYTRSSPRQILIILTPTIAMLIIFVLDALNIVYFPALIMIVASSYLSIYLVWTIFLIQGGQTIGKKLVRIQSVRQNGESAGWGLTFVREIIKFFLHVFIIGFVIDSAMLLSDKEEHQSVADRIAGTVIVRVSG